MDHQSLAVRTAPVREEPKRVAVPQIKIPAVVQNTETNYGEYCTPAEVRRICSIVHPGNDSVVYELGCADGRFCIELSRYQCSVIGIEIDESRVRLARQKIAKLPESRRNRIRIIHGDIKTAGLIESQATHVIIHQMPSLLADVALRFYRAEKLECICSIAHPLAMHQGGGLTEYWWSWPRVKHDQGRFYVYRR